MKIKNRRQLAICGLVSSAITPDCTNVNIAGLDVIIYIANWSEVAGYTRNGTTDAVEAITMASTKKFYAWEGKKTSNNAKQALRKGKYQSSFEHEVSGIFFPVDATSKLQLHKAANGSFIIIVKYKYKGSAGNCKYEVYGIDQGLELSTLERDQSNADNVGAYAFTFKTPDGFAEQKLPATLYITSEAATDAVVAALL